MSEQDNANPEANKGSDNTEEQMNEEFDLTDLDSNEDIESMRKTIRTLSAQKNHFREKHKKLSEDPRLKEQEKKPEPKPKEEKKTKKKDDGFDPEAFKKEVREEALVRQQNPNLTAEEFERAKRLAKADGKTLSEMIADPFFQAYVKANEEKRVEEKARPESSNRSGSPKSGSIDDLSDPKKVSEMDMDTFKELSDKAGKGSSRLKIIRK